MLNTNETYLITYETHFWKAVTYEKVSVSTH